VQSTGGIPVVDEIFTPEITERENLPLHLPLHWLHTDTEEFAELSYFHLHYNNSWEFSFTYKRKLSNV